MPSHNELVSAVAATSPLLYYPMSTAGQGAVSSISFASQGSVTGVSATMNSTVVSGSMSASGTLIPGDAQQYLTIGSASSVRLVTGIIGTVLGVPLSNLTMQIIVRPADGSGTPDSFWGWPILHLGKSGTGSADNYQFTYGMLSDFSQKFVWEYTTSATDQIVSGGYFGSNFAMPSPIAKTLHFIITRDATTKQITIYFNGALDEQISYANDATHGSNAKFSVIGVDAGSVNSLAGTYGHAALWGRVLSMSEIASLFTASGIYFTAPSADRLSLLPVDAQIPLAQLSDLLSPIANKSIEIYVDGTIDTGSLDPANEYYWS
jgi:hypothetical protein